MLILLLSISLIILDNSNKFAKTLGVFKSSARSQYICSKIVFIFSCIFSFALSSEELHSIFLTFFKVFINFK